MMLYVGTTSKKTKKQRAKERQAWNEQQKKYQLASLTKKGKAFQSCVNVSPLDLNSDRLASKFPSKDSGQGVAAKKTANTYTGDNVIGIGMMHKSNLVPVFKGEEAKDLSSMRR